MNKRLFVGLTAVTVVAGAVAGAVYYRHVLTKALDKWAAGDQEAGLFLEDPSPNDLDQYNEADI